MPLNTTDRKIIDTGRNALRDDQEFRAPEVRIVGAEYEVKPTPAQDPDTKDTADRTDIGVVRNIQIESQDVRIQPDGSAVVDVTLSFEGAEQAAKHELRLTKI